MLKLVEELGNIHTKELLEAESNKDSNIARGKVKAMQQLYKWMRNLYSETRSQ